MSGRVLNNELKHIGSTLRVLDPSTEEYTIAARNLLVLSQAKKEQSSLKISADTVVLAVTNILGIVLILQYEQLHPVVSKALGMLKRT